VGRGPEIAGTTVKQSLATQLRENVPTQLPQEISNHVEKRPCEAKTMVKQAVKLLN